MTLDRLSYKNVGSKRATGSAKHRQYAAVAKRDGAECASCRTPEKRSWRNVGSKSWQNVGPSLDKWRGYYLPDGTHVWGPSLSVAYCSNLQLDHLIELVDGGSGRLSNLQLLCEPCHRRKSIDARRARRIARSGK